MLALFGNTYARYTSAGEGDAAVSVALWDVESVPVTISGKYISPSKDEYSGDTRKSISRWQKAFEVVNYSAVRAAIYPEADENGVSFEWTDGFAWDAGIADRGSNGFGVELMEHFDKENDEGKTGEDYFREVVSSYGVFSAETGFEVPDTINGMTRNKIFTEEDSSRGERCDVNHPFGEDGEIDEGLYVGDTSALDIDGFLYDAWGVYGPDYGLNLVEPDGGTCNVYVEVIWTSIYEGGGGEGFYRPSDFGFGTDDTEDDWAAFSDAVDTILCMYAKDISFVVSLNAVQASTLP